MLFQMLTELCEKLSATTKRNQMIKNVADFLKILEDEEVEPAVSMLLGRAFPKWDQRTLDVNWTTISNVVERLTKTNWKEFSAAFRKTGDIGSATQVVFEVNRVHRQAALFEEPLTISEVRKILEAIAEATGQGASERKERLIESLFGRAKPLEAKYLVKILIGEMRTGFHEGLMELAVSEAFSIQLKEVQRATMYTGDIGEVAKICKKQGAKGVSNLGFTIFRPIKPMLAKMAENLDEPLREYGGKAAFEYKLDGARIQIHKLGN
ncbi:MAG: DNA ligase, partial [Candidatus Bathyarchaeia archaeon]